MRVESVGVREPLDGPDETDARQVVAGDGGRDVACRQQRGPGAWRGFESKWPAPGDQVTHKGGHLIDLSWVGWIRIESESRRHTGQGSKEHVGTGRSWNLELGCDRGQRAPAEKSKHDHEVLVRRQALGQCIEAERRLTKRCSLGGLDRGAAQSGYAVQLRPMPADGLERRFGEALVNDLHQLGQVEPAYFSDEDPGGRVLRVEPVAGPADGRLIRRQEPAVEDLGPLPIGEPGDHAQSRRCHFDRKYEPLLHAPRLVTAASIWVHQKPICRGRREDLPPPSLGRPFSTTDRRSEQKCRATTFQLLRRRPTIFTPGGTVSSGAVRFSKASALLVRCCLRADSWRLV